MSSLPGLFLEDFLAWNYDLDVEGEARDHNITKERFAPLVAMFEPYREDLETWLANFDEEEQSWRDYACGSDIYIPHEAFKRGREYLDAVGVK